MIRRFLDFLTKRQTAFVVFGYAIAAYFLLLGWDGFTAMQKMGYVLYLGLCLHQLEEYCFPGGFLWGLNTVLGTHDAMRWPGDRLSAGLCDIIATSVGLYFIVFQPTPFIACCFAFLGLIEFLVHTMMGFILRARLKHKGKSTIYVPGTASCWLLFLPVSCVVLTIVIQDQILSISQIGIAAACVIAFLGATVILPVLFLQDKNSVYTYANLPGFYQKYLNKEGDNYYEENKA